MARITIALACGFIILAGEFREPQEQRKEEQIARLVQEAVKAHEKGDYQEAIRKYKDANTLYVANFDTKKMEYGLILNNLAFVYMDTERFAEADELLTQAEKLSPDGTLEDDGVGILIAMTRTCLSNRIGDVPNCLEATLRAVVLYRKRPREAAICMPAMRRNLGIAYRRMGEYETGYRLIREARALLLKNNPNELERLRKYDKDIARIAIESGQLNEAENILIPELQACEKTGQGTETESYSSLLQFVGWLRYEQGRFDEAAHIYEKALKILTSLNAANSRCMANLNRELARTYVKKGDMAKAETFARKALDLQRRVPCADSIDLADVLQTLASTLASTKRREADQCRMEEEGIRKRLKQAWTDVKKKNQKLLAEFLTPMERTETDE